MDPTTANITSSILFTLVTSTNRYKLRKLNFSRMNSTLLPWRMSLKNKKKMYTWYETAQKKLILYAKYDKYWWRETVIWRANRHALKIIIMESVVKTFESTWNFKTRGLYKKRMRVSFGFHLNKTYVTMKKQSEHSINIWVERGNSNRSNTEWDVFSSPPHIWPAAKSVRD